jgi:hypothetical protein
MGHFFFDYVECEWVHNLGELFLVDLFFCLEPFSLVQVVYSDFF